MPKTERKWIQGPVADLATLQFLPENADALELARVIVHNVGQGNGNALCSTADAKPILYFDVGCSAWFNAKTCPETLEYDFANEPWIILSHWDFDHWHAGFNQKWATAQKCDWLAPRQKISAQHQTQASRLKNKLRLWPDRKSPGFQERIVGEIGEAAVTIVRSVGDAEEDRNDSGLAMIIEKGVNRILLPGDGRYDYIPGLDGGTWLGLVATHHGSKTNLLAPISGAPIDAVPNGLDGGVIIYSAAPTKYGHPNPDAMNAYKEKNWTEEKFTTAGEQQLDLP